MAPLRGGLHAPDLQCEPDYCIGATLLQKGENIQIGLQVITL